MYAIRLFQTILNRSLQCLDIGTNDLTDLLTTLEQDECGHGADSESGSDLGQIVDVDLAEEGGGVLLGESAKQPC